MSTAAIVGGSLAAAGGSIAGGAIQAGAANNAAGLQAQEAQNALNFQEQQWNTQQQNQAPWLAAGRANLSQLEAGLSPLPGSSAAGPSNAIGTRPGGGSISGQPYQTGAGSLIAPWTGQFNAPTAAQAAAYPGEQFQLGQGEQAVQRSAAANGDLLTGGTLKDITNYAQGLASTDYQQVYNNQLTQYQQAYNQYQQAEGNAFNRLAAGAGIGQTAVGQLGSEGQAASGNVSNIDLTAGQQIGQNINLAGAATGSGYVNAANSLGGAIGTIGTYQALQQLLGTPAEYLSSGLGSPTAGG